MPVTATWSGDTLLVFDIEQAKVSSYVDATVAAEDVSISPDFITPVVASGEIGFVAVTAERGVILRQPLQAAHNADSTWLAVSRFRPMSGVTDTLIFEPVRMITLTGHSNFIQPGAAHSTIAFGANGWTAVSAADGTYRILIRDADDNPVRQVSATQLSRWSRRLPRWVRAPRLGAWRWRTQQSRMLLRRRVSMQSAG